MLLHVYAIDDIFLNVHQRYSHGDAHQCHLGGLLYLLAEPGFNPGSSKRCRSWSKSHLVVFEEFGQLHDVCGTPFMSDIAAVHDLDVQMMNVALFERGSFLACQSFEP